MMLNQGNLRSAFNSFQTIRKFHISLCYKCGHASLNSSNLNENKIEADELSTGSVLSKDPIVLKYRNYFVKAPDISGGVNEIVYSTKFGSIRFDSDNIPTEASELQDDPETLESDSTNYVDQTYFGKSMDTSFNSSPNIHENLSENDNADVNNSELNYIDSNYFQKSSCENEKVELKSNPEKLISDSDELNHIDEQYIYNGSGCDTTDKSSHLGGIDLPVYSFEESISDMESNSDMKNTSNIEINVGRRDTENSNVILKKSPENLQALQDRLDDLQKLMPPRKNVQIQATTSSSDNELGKVIEKGEQQFTNNRSKPEYTENYIVEKPKTAYDYVTKVRQKEKEENLDNGENIEGNAVYVGRLNKILGFIPNFKESLRYDVVKRLHQHVIYNKCDIIAINKPYGISMHGGKAGESHNCPYTITDLLPDLAERLGVAQLHSIHRLDMNTSGVLLLASSTLMTDYLKRLFKQHLIQKSYLAITKAIPSPLEGVIDIPIGEGSVDSYRRMVLFPDVDGLRARNGQSKRAVTKYQVLSHDVNSSLVELNPKTGIKHQLRVHLGFGLSCPILGDHKYSHVKKMAPQRLPGDILNKLGVKQSKVRNLPIFLHSWKLQLPSYLRRPLQLNPQGIAIEDAATAHHHPITIRAVLPKYFKNTTKYLNLSTRKNFTQNMKIGLIMDRKEDWED